MCSTRQRLSALLKEQRVARGFSLRCAAELAQIAPSTLSRWESGSCLPRVPELEALLVALGVGQEDILRILASLDAPRAARAIRERSDDSQDLVAPSGGALLRALRSKAKLPLSDVAESLAVSVSTVSRWESGSSHPSVEQLDKILTRVGASPDARECLATSGVAKLQALRPAYREEEFSSQVAKLEQAVQSPDENTELHLLQLQAMLWWFRDKSGATQLLHRVVLIYASLLIKEGRYREAIQQAQSVLDSGSAVNNDAKLRARRLLARADVYRWEPPRPHLGLFMLESCLSESCSRSEQILLLSDMAEYSVLAERFQDAAAYRSRATEEIAPAKRLEIDLLPLLVGSPAFSIPACQIVATSSAS